MAIPAVLEGGLREHWRRQKARATGGTGILQNPVYLAPKGINLQHAVLPGAHDGILQGQRPADIPALGNAQGNASHRAIED
jgi:hypothetical protein